MEQDEWDALKKRINRRSPQTRSKIAARAALRAFPPVTHRWIEDLGMDQFDLVIARALLTTIVSSFEQSPKIDTLAYACAISAESAAENLHHIYTSMATQVIVCAAFSASHAENNDASADAVKNSVYAVSRFSAHRAENEAAADVTFAVSKQDTHLQPDGIFLEPLWFDYDSKHQKVVVWPEHRYSPYRTLQGRYSPFWREWYQGFLDGKPLDWALQKEIALIPDTDWEKGPEWIAEKIEIIRKRRDLEAEIATLKEQLKSAKSAATLPSRLHNQPPEAVDDPAQVFQRELTVIWGEIDALETEIEKRDPSPKVLARIASRISEIAISIAKYCGSVLDVSVKAGAIAIGTVGGTAIAAELALPGSMQAVVKSILEFAKALGG